MANSFYSAVVSTVILAFASVGTQAGIIDTRPPDSVAAYLVGTGADTAGGTFTADDSLLESFTLDISDSGTGGVFRAVVMSVAGGLPTGVLWESADIAIPGSTTELLFMPSLAIVSGMQYFIGADSGQVTGTAGGDFGLGYRDSDVLSGGEFTQNLNGGGFATFPDLDIASRIVMTSAVPLPGTLALLGLGLLALGSHRRRA
jgi:uncharacterized protein (TIGR03382 family)